MISIEVGKSGASFHGWTELRAARACIAESPQTGSLDLPFGWKRISIEVKKFVFKMPSFT